MARPRKMSMVELVEARVAQLRHNLSSDTQTKWKQEVTKLENVVKMIQEQEEKTRTINEVVADIIGSTVKRKGGRPKGSGKKTKDPNAPKRKYVRKKK